MIDTYNNYVIPFFGGAGAVIVHAIIIAICLVVGFGVVFRKDCDAMKKFTFAFMYVFTSIIFFLACLTFYNSAVNIFPNGKIVSYIPLIMLYMSIGVNIFWISKQEEPSTAIFTIVGKIMIILLVLGVIFEFIV